MRRQEGVTEIGQTLRSNVVEAHVKLTWINMGRGPKKARLSSDFLEDIVTILRYDRDRDVRTSQSGELHHPETIDTWFNNSRDETVGKNKRNETTAEVKLKRRRTTNRRLVNTAENVEDTAALEKPENVEPIHTMTAGQ